MSASSNAPPLNAEPSNPEDRAAEGLAPKSYKEATEEGLEAAKKRQAAEAAKRKEEDARAASGIKKANGSPIEESKYVSADGNTLTSTVEPLGYRQSLVQDAKELKHHKTDDAPQKSKSDLASGKQPGQGWHNSAIRWAPLNVPLQRRLQTLAVLWHSMGIPIMIGAFFFCCSIPIFWPILIPYMIYCLFSQASVSGELSHRSEWLRSSLLWSLFASYYPARLHRSQELSPNRKYIFGYHPHGIISHGAFAAFATEALGFSQLFPGIKNTLLTLDSNFRTPFYRDYVLAMGLASVGRESCENLLNKGGRNGEGMGRAITIVVGGARESLGASPNQMKLVLKSRKGFIKLAIRNGADLVPVFGFGENELYDQFSADDHPYVHKMQLIIKKLMGFTIPLFHARGIFNYDVGLLPYRRSINVVVGKPINVEQQKNPDPAYVDQMHQRYMDELQRLWDEWKDTFAKDRTYELEMT